MKIHDSLAVIAEQMHDVECKIVDVELVRYLGSHEVEFDVEVITIAGIPVSHFKEETVRDVASQLRHDSWLQHAAAQMVRIDTFGDRMDRAHDEQREAI